MVNRVVATKLNEEEHTKLLDACNSIGCTPSAFIKKAILESVGSERKDRVDEMTLDELREELGIKTRIVGIKNTSDEEFKENKP